MSPKKAPMPKKKKGGPAYGRSARGSKQKGGAKALALAWCKDCSRGGGRGALPGPTNAPLADLNPVRKGGIACRRWDRARRTMH